MIGRPDVYPFPFLPKLCLQGKGCMGSTSNSYFPQPVKDPFSLCSVAPLPNWKDETWACSLVDPQMPIIQERREYIQLYVCAGS